MASLIVKDRLFAMAHRCPTLAARGNWMKQSWRKSKKVMLRMRSPSLSDMQVYIYFSCKSTSVSHSGGKLDCCQKGCNLRFWACRRSQSCQCLTDCTGLSQELHKRHASHYQQYHRGHWCRLCGSRRYQSLPRTSRTAGQLSISKHIHCKLSSLVSSGNLIHLIYMGITKKNDNQNFVGQIW